MLCPRSGDEPNSPKPSHVNTIPSAQTAENDVFSI